MLMRRIAPSLQRIAARSDTGAAIVEFAMVAPVLVLLLFGITDIAMTTLAKFKSSNATLSAADLATQSINLQSSDMADIYAGAKSVMAPFSNANLLLRITSVASNGNGTAFVHWSCGEGALPPFTAKSTVTKLADGSSVDNILNRSTFSAGGYTYNGTNMTYIQVESQYVYTAPTKFFIKTAQTMNSAFYIYPRQAAYVGFLWDGNANLQPTAPASTTSTGSVTLSSGAICNYAY